MFSATVMWVKGVVLEDHGNVAGFWGDLIHRSIADTQAPLGDVLAAGHHAKGRSLVATGRTDEDHELTVGDLQIEIRDSSEAVQLDLGHLFDRYRRYQSSSLKSWVAWAMSGTSTPSALA